MTVTKTSHFDIRKKIVANMTTESWHNIPHVSYLYDADATEFLKVVAQLNNQNRPRKITINMVLMKVVAECLKAAPKCNAHIEFNHKYVTGTIKEIKEIDMSIPMMLPSEEMMTINLHNMGERSLDNIAELMEITRKKLENTNTTEAMFSVSMDNTLKALKKGKLGVVIRRLIGAKIGKSRVILLKGKAKREYNAIPEDERITYKDIEQGTVTFSNVGSICRDQRGMPALLEIIPPQVFALVASAVQKKPVVVTDENGNDKVEIREMIPFCIAFDHRAMDFDGVVPFLRRMYDIFDHPEQILNW